MEILGSVRFITITEGHHQLSITLIQIGINLEIVKTKDF
jgi:hypothetical protein